MAATANLVEIFSSLQGEGPHVGAPTLFVRLGACDLRCRWCDSPHTWLPAARCRIETPDGERAVENPVGLDDALAACRALGLARHDFVSLTGGEPLLQPEAVGALAEGVAGAGARILLETHGLAVAALERVIDRVDVVSMDWKLASDVRRESDPKRGPVASFHEAHEAFLRVATRAPEVVVKIVVTTASTDAEIDEACGRIAAVDPAIPLVLQPVTPFAGVRERPGAERLLALSRRAREPLRHVRVFPQTHPVIGAP